MATSKRESLVKSFLDQRHPRKHSSRKTRHPLRGHRHLVTLSEEELARREQGWNDRFAVDPPPKSNKAPSPLRSPTFSTPPTPLTKESRICNERAQYGKRGRRNTREPKKPSSGRLVPLGSLSKPPSESAQSSIEEKLRFKVLKSIDARETLLYQLSALILCTPVQESLFLPSRPAEPPTSNSASRQKMRSRGGMALASTPLSRHGGTMTNAREATKLAQQLATDLQITGIQCVESLVEWMLEAGAQAESPPPFLWRGRNYFLKMIKDLDFAEAELQARGVNLDCFKKRNPLLIKPKQKLGRVLAAHSIIMEMVEFAKDMTPKELLALSGRIRDSALEENEANVADGCASKTPITGATELSSTGNTEHFPDDMDLKQKYEDADESQAMDHHETASDLVNLLDESLDFILPPASREGDTTLAEVSYDDDAENDTADNNTLEKSIDQVNELLPKIAAKNGRPTVDLEPEDVDKTDICTSAVENDTAEADTPVKNNQSDEDDNYMDEDEQIEGDENDGKATTQSMPRLSTPPLRDADKGNEPEQVNNAPPVDEVALEESEPYELGVIMDPTSEHEQHSSRTNESNNQSEYDNSFEGEADEGKLNPEAQQLPLEGPVKAHEVNESPEHDEPAAPEDRNCGEDEGQGSESTPAAPINSPETLLSSRTEGSNQEYDNSFDEDADDDTEDGKEDTDLNAVELESPSDTTRATNLTSFSPIQGLQLQLGQLVHANSDLPCPETNDPQSVSQRLADELQRWSFLKDVNAPAEVNAQGCLSWCSTRALTETLQRHSSICGCKEGSIISMLEQYELAVPESPLQSLLSSEVAKELDLVAHLFEECHCVLGDICFVVAEDIHRSLQSKNSLVSEIEISEVLETTEGARQECHDSTWEYLKTATALLTFLRASEGELFAQPDKRIVASAGLSHLVKVFYPYLVNQPREELSDNWHLVQIDLAAMGLHVDQLYFMLDPMCKTLLLAVNLCGESNQGPEHGDDFDAAVIPKVTVVCDREDILQSTVEYVWRSHLSADNVLTNFALFPFFKSSFGEKIVDGIMVEEGEGKGPLKEWFRLIGSQLSSKWKQVSIGTTISEPENQLTASGNAITIPKSGGAICAGYQLEWESSDGEAISRIVNKCVEDDTYLLDRTVQPHSFPASQLRVSQPVTAFFEYVQGSESYWLNENSRDSPENRNTLVFVGWVFASAIMHFSSLQLRVHPLLFRLLLKPTYGVTLDDLRLFNPPLFNSLAGMKEMKPSDFAEYLKFEGVDEGLSVEAYIDKVLQEKFGPESGIGWQLDSVRRGFTRVISIEQIVRASIDEIDLGEIIYGCSGGGGQDFTISKIFRIAADSDFTSCQPLANTFWQTVNGFDPQLKRKFIKFVTGVDTLPLSGTEFLRIEMPFTAISSDDHEKSLQMLPQAHTCDNTLELPHYWKALCWREHQDENERDSKLEEELAALLHKKLKDAVEYSSGYGLDGTSSGAGLSTEKFGGDEEGELAKEDSYDSLGLPELSARQSATDLPIESSQRSLEASDRYEPDQDEDATTEDAPVASPANPVAAASPRRPDESYDEYDWEEEEKE